MRGKIGAIYDTLLVFKEDDPAPPTVKSLLLGKTMTAHVYINRIPLEEVPATEPEQEEFLRQLFVKKVKGVSVNEHFLRFNFFAGHHEG